MEIREFLKPTLGKILMTIIIAIVPVYKRIICPFIPPCFDVWLNVFSISNQFLNNKFLGTEGFIGKSRTYKNLAPDVLTYSMIYILSIFMIYLISCFTVHIYKKLNSNHKK